MVEWIKGVSLGASLTTLVAMGGCAVVPPVAAPSLQEKQTISLGVEGAWSVNVDSADDLVIDANGAYFCLLRRADDLAELRSQFFVYDLGK